MKIEYAHIFLFCFISILFVSCKKQIKNSSTQTKTETVYINKIERIDNSLEIVPEKFIKQKKYIKLFSESEDFLFKEINKIRIIDDKIYILDKKQKKLLIYDNIGFSEAKVGSKGNGPNEYLDISDFDVDTQGNIYTIDGILNKLFIYNPDLSIKRVLLLPFEADILTTLENDNLMFGLSAWNEGENKGASIVITDNNLKTIEVISQYDEFVDNAYWISHYSFVKTDKNISYHKSINNNLHIYSKNGKLEKVIVFDFDKKDVPLQERKDIEGNIEKFKGYNLLKWITIIEDNFILGTFWENRETKSFFIDREKDLMYVSDPTIDRDIGVVAGFDGKTLIQFFIPGSDRVEQSDLPEDIKAHLDNGDFALCLYLFK